MDWLNWLLEDELWPPRRLCGEWPDYLVYMTSLSELVTCWCYLAVAVTLFILAFSGSVALKGFLSVRLRVLFVLFAAIFFTCGTGHFLGGVLVFWVPVYRLIAAWAVLTAIVGVVGMPILIWTVIRSVFEFGRTHKLLMQIKNGPEEFRHIHDEFYKRA